MKKDFGGKRIFIVAACIAVMLMPAAAVSRAADSPAQGTGNSDAVYLAFTSDVHNTGSNTEAEHFKAWLISASEDLGGRFDYVGVCGDTGSADCFGDSYWDNVQNVIDVITESSAVKTGGFLTAGNHEHKNGDIDNTPNETADGYAPIGTVIEKKRYILYSFGSSQWDEIYTEENIQALDSYLAKHSEFAGPIFIVAHFPLNTFGSGSGESSAIHDGSAAVGSGELIEVLNEYPNAVFLWGHNHSSTDEYYDIVHTNDINGTPIDFTYASAGCMSDREYRNGAGAAIEGKGLTAVIKKDSVTFAYYDIDGQRCTEPVKVLLENVKVEDAGTQAARKTESESSTEGEPGFWERTVVNIFFTIFRF